MKSKSTPLAPCGLCQLVVIRLGICLLIDWFLSGQYFPLGAVLFTQSPSYAETFRVVNSSGVGFDTFDPAYAYDYDPKTGAAALVQPSTPAIIQALQEELGRYAGLWKNDFAPIGVPGYKASKN